MSVNNVSYLYRVRKDEKMTRCSRTAKLGMAACPLKSGDLFWCRVALASAWTTTKVLKEVLDSFSMEMKDSAPLHVTKEVRALHHKSS